MPNGTVNRPDTHFKPATMIRKTPNEHPLLFLISIVVFIEPVVIIYGIVLKNTRRSRMLYTS